MFVNNSTVDLDPLIESSIEITRQTPETPFLSLISKYNFFVDIYNQDINRCDSAFLSRIPHSSCHEFYCSLKSKMPLTFLYFFLIFLLPVINLVLIGIIFIELNDHSRAKKIHLKNQSLVSDPFRRMIFSPGICQNLKKTHWFFEIEVKSLPGLFVNFEAFPMAHPCENNIAKFMVYNEEFASYYKDLPLYEIVMIRDAILGVLLFFLNIGGYVICFFFIFDVFQS